ncbi:MAG: hypothetical protein K0Q72_247 [Armatimonadetes bacterium]|jgi:hypothetical protein|nr:hypothetical protein [Armatimonadota bacterium]
MIPREVVDEVALSVTEAFGLGYEGRVPRGYLILSDGAWSARSLPPECSGCVARVWELALDRFMQEFPREWYPAASD